MIDKRRSFRLVNAINLYIAKHINGNEAKYTWDQALRESGYADKYVVNHAKHLWGKSEVQEQIKSAIARRTVKSELNREKVEANIEMLLGLALEKGDLATAARCIEMQGKSIAMFTDKIQGETITIPSFDQGEIDRIKELSRLITRERSVKQVQNTYNAAVPLLQHVADTELASGD